MLENKYKQMRISEHISLYDKIIPKDHILRKIKENVDFSFVNKLVENEYCKSFGIPANEPELMFKLLFLEIKDCLSDREVIKRMNIEESQKQSGKMLDIYNVKVEGCAYEGGYRGDGKELDYITILTLPKEKQEGKQEKETIIAIFPSKKLDLRERKREEIEQEIEMD